MGWWCMTDPDDQARWHRVEAWMHHAWDDARIARGRLGLDPPALGGAAYHCQQAAEKLLKAFLVLGAVDFRRTHDLDTLAQAVLPRFPLLRSLLAPLGACTTWGVAYRHPGEDEPEPEPSADDLRSALDLVAQLDAALRSHAPSAPADTGEQ
jgi:hypothetical protein